MSGTRRAILDAVRRGSSAALVLRGDAGMGETTLLEYALRSAADMRTVRLVGVQSDSGFGFGALHRLFIPFHGSHRVPSGSSARCDRDGLRVSWTARCRIGFGRVGNSDGVFGGSCGAGASVRGDDVQWIDRESFDVLGLVARRLLLEGLPGLDIAGLDEHPGVGRR